MRKQSLFVNIVLFGCILSILPVIAVGVFSYVQSSKEVQLQVRQSKIQFIQQMNSNIEQLLITVNHTLNNLSESTIMEAALNSPITAYDFKLYNYLRTEMTRMQAYDSRILDVVLVNDQQDWIVKNSGLYRLNEYRYANELLNFLDQPGNHIWALTRQSLFTAERRVPLDDSFAACEYNISLVKQLPLQSRTKSGLAFANIPACHIVDMVSFDKESEEMIIVNENFEIIVHSDLTMIGKPWQDTGLPELASHFNGDTGQYNVTRSGTSYTVTYFRSSFNNWTYMLVTSIDALTKESKKIGWFTVYICLIIILLSSIFIWFMSSKIYSPVHKLIEYIRNTVPDSVVDKKNELQIINEQLRKLFSSNSRLENELQEHSKQVKFLFLNRLFSGSIKTSEINEKIQYFRLNEKLVGWTQLNVLTLQIDTLEQTRYQSTDSELLKFAISNIIEELVPVEKRFPPVWIDQTLAFIVGYAHSDEHHNHTDILNLAEQIQQNIDQYLSLSVSIGISMPYTELKKSYRAYQEGIEALKHRIKLGKCVIIHYSSINSGKHTMVYHYPKDHVVDMSDAIKIGDAEKAVIQLELWMNKAFSTNQPITEYQVSMMRLLNHLLIIKQEYGIKDEQLSIQDHSLYEELLTLHVIDEIKDWFKNKLVLPLAKVFKDRQDSQYHNLSEQIIDMIHNHFDTDITLEECASKLHYNANYLSSVFKKETQQTFSEYLAKYRLAVAKKWLLENNMTVTEIADRLRYTNPQNFIRSFRKQENMTPGQYRQKYS